MRDSHGDRDPYFRLSSNYFSSAGHVFEEHNSGIKNANLIKIETTKERVLMDQDGPGAITRIWMPYMRPDMAAPRMDSNTMIRFLPR